MSVPEAGMPRGLRDKNGYVVVAGDVATLDVGTSCDIQGKIETHSKFGMQVIASQVQIRQPSGLREIKAFLEKRVHSIGPHFASQIVRHFGEDTMQVLGEDPERLREIPGVAKKRIEGIIESYADLKDSYELMILLSKGQMLSCMARIKNKYKEEVVEVVSSDPYRLAREIKGVGFGKADMLARNLGWPEQSEQRIVAAACHFLWESSNKAGHCFVYMDDLVQGALDIMATPSITHEMAHNAISNAVGREEIVTRGPSDNFMYLPEMDRLENAVANQICEMVRMPVPDELAGECASRVTDKIIQSSEITLDPIQVNAIRMCLSSKVSVLTGPPGTGKTTIAKCVVDGLREAGVTVTLVAPTGKAACRMSEVIDHYASTIHKRMVGCIKNKTRISGAIVIDETSMVDIHLINSLLGFVEPECMIIFIGDDEQLPAVGPGAILRDLIASDHIPTVKLTKVFRQAEGSDIVVNASSIIGNSIDGRPVNPGTIARPNYMGRRFGIPEGKNFYVAPIEDAKEQQRAVSWLMTDFLPAMGYDAKADCQILAPMYGGECGVDNLNTSAQRLLNPNPEYSMKVRDQTWGVGDRVMQLKNDYDLDIWNGDQGVIAHIDQEHKNGKSMLNHVLVDFSGRSVEIPAEKVGRLRLCYASTIHKVQGCEFPVVIMVLHRSHYIMLKRNLFYTGITRGRELVVVVSDPDALDRALRNEDTSRRNTDLVTRIEHRMEEPHGTAEQVSDPQDCRHQEVSQPG